MSYIYASTSHPTFTKAIFAAYADWITAQGGSSRTEVADVLGVSSDEELADELLAEGWGNAVYTTEYDDGGDRIDVPQAARQDWIDVADAFRTAMTEDDADLLDWWD